MSTNAVSAPVSLLRDLELSASAKLIWLLLQRHPGGGPLRLPVIAERSGLCRNTILKALANLQANGWYAPDVGAVNRAPKVARIAVPPELLIDRRVGVQGRILYALLQLMPHVRPPDGRFTYAALSQIAGVQARTVRCAIAELVSARWLRTAQENRLTPINFTLCNPTADRARAMLAGAKWRVKKATYKGEAIMREILTLLVDSEQFEDNATPGFLVNPLTKELLQLDRYYPLGVAPGIAPGAAPGVAPGAAAGVGFEFNGPQHDGPTELFSAESAAEQQVRDVIKLGVCQRKGVTVVVVHSEDLSLEIMRQKVGQLLPLRDLTGHEHLIAFLEARGRRYRSAAQGETS
jgi:hypothetical protein